MPNLGAALRAELARAVGVKALREDLREVAREVKRIGLLLRRRPLREFQSFRAEAAPSIPSGQIRALRAEFGESRKAFAERLGVSSSIVYLWESGRSIPSRPALVRRIERLLAAGKGRGAERPPAAKRSVRLSPQRRAALQLQGKYMGYLRNLAKGEKTRVKALRASKGYPAAIELARRLAKS